MDRLIFVFLFFISPFSLFSQQLNWLVAIEDSSDFAIVHSSYEIASNQFDEVLIAGPTEPYVNLTSLFGNLNIKILSNTQEVLFSTTLSGPARAKQIVSDGDYFYIFGEFIDFLEIDGFPLLSSGVGAFQETDFLLKLHRDGTTIWVKNLSELFEDTFTTVIDVGQSGSLYLGLSENINADSEIVQMNAAGEITETWTQISGGLISSLSANSEGEVTVAGSCTEGDVEFNGTTIPEEFDDYNSYVVRYSTSGEYLWHFFLHDVSCDGPQAFTAEDGTTYLVGEANAISNLGDFEIEPSTFVSSLYYAAIDESGDVLWANQPELVETENIGDAAPARGNTIIPWNDAILLGGFTRGYLTWGESIISDLELPGEALFLAGVQISGEVDHLILSDFSTFNQKVLSISKGGENSFYMLGSIYDAISLQGVTLPNTGTALFLSHWQASALETSKIERLEMSHYPDPAQDQIVLKGYERNDEIVLLDLTGRTVSRTTHAGDGRVYLPKLTSGTYLIQVLRNDEVIYRSTIRLVH
jgi:hypothetical protein